MRLAFAIHVHARRSTFQSAIAAFRPAHGRARLYCASVSPRRLAISRSATSSCSDVISPLPQYNDEKHSLQHRVYFEV